jgi:hypothetical protein
MVMLANLPVLPVLATATMEMPILPARVAKT